MALTKRTGLTKKRVEKEKEEPNTICAGVEPVKVKDDSVRCAECSNRVWKEDLCYSHWKESQGFVFDETKKLYVRPKGKK